MLVGDGIESCHPGDPTPQEIFRYQTAAARAIYDRLTVEDRRQVDKQSEVVVLESNPANIQQK